MSVEDVEPLQAHGLGQPGRECAEPPMRKAAIIDILCQLKQADSLVGRDAPQGEKASMFFAAFISRLCRLPQRVQTHSLTPSALSPLGPERAPQSVK